MKLRREGAIRVGTFFLIFFLICAHGLWNYTATRIPRSSRYFLSLFTRLKVVRLRVSFLTHLTIVTGVSYRSEFACVCSCLPLKKKVSKRDHGEKERERE